jgi:NAD(P)-dependent dehydrogenase (short-subunit alcohol dehydrogenase family)
MDTHFYGTLSMVLASNGGGAIVNLLSALSWFSFDGSTAYCAAKSAEWGLTNGIRLELAGQGTLVTGVHVGAVDTDMMAGIDFEKIDPGDVVRAALDGLEVGQREVIVDDYSAQIKARLAADPSELYPQTVGG